ncbi:MAG: arabinose ABC transporter permease [Betaproteobacteria bacterium RIFCSPLOWO2_02_64_14]|nr:MAG: arabinose ABC transporter permease [Betaproteobacteria bacterium RIFCSPLOWO2_02_64_14]
MSAAPRVSALAPFRVRSYRFQWPADLATSWAFEMEALILGWYVLVETGSVLLLTVFASLQYTGTLLAPMFGVVGHRIGTKKLLCGMRATYATLATTLMTLAFTGILSPVYVFIIAALLGIVRPSDLVMRYALIGETMPATQFVGATSVSRTTQDSARIAGALTGAGLVAALGIGPAYLAIAGLYATSLLLTLNVAGRRPVPHPAGDAAGVSMVPRARSSVWRDLRDGVACVWTTPQLLAAMVLAFLVNMTAFPLVNALLPYVAREIYRTDQTGLGYLLASWAFGALLGSLTLSRIGYAIRPARTMLVACALWYAMIVVFAQMERPTGGSVALMFAGFAQSVGMISMSAMLLRTAGDEFRSRVMGIRMLAVYGLPIGLLISGPLIRGFGYPATATLYCAIGLAITLMIAVRWRAHLWRPEAPANTR